MKQIVNGVEVDLTLDEEAEYNARQQAWLDDTPNRLKANFTIALEKAVNDKALEKTYSSGVSCASYAQSTNTQWAAEAQAYIAWRDSMYEYGFDYLARALSGEIPNPTIDDFLAGAPAIEWPDVQE